MHIAVLRPAAGDPLPAQTTPRHGSDAKYINLRIDGETNRLAMLAARRRDTAKLVGQRIEALAAGERAV